MQLHYLDENKVRKVMIDVHKRVCGPHMNGTTLAKKIMRQEFFWMTMVEDYIRFTKKCHKCQIYKDISHFPHSKLHTMSSPWPFSVWGLDIIGEIHPTASNGHRYILVTIDYFTKWVKIESYNKLGAKQVAKFLERNLFYRYRIPHHLIFDNRVQFQGEV